MGNIIRGAANKFSGGVLGNGAGMMQADSQPHAPIVNMDAIKGNVFDALGGAVDKSPTVKKALVEGVWSKYKFYMLGAVAVIVGITIFLTRRKKTTTYKKRY